MKSIRRIATLLFAGALASSIHAADVAVLDVTSGDNDIVAELNAAGHSASTVTQAEVTGGILSGYDVYVAGRNWCCDAHDAAYRDAVVAFVNSGGGLVTEWDNYAFLFDGYDATFRYSDALPQGEFISGEVGGGQNFGSTLQIDNAMAHPIWDALPASISVSGIEFPYTTYNADLSDWDVVATWTGDGSPNFPAQVFPMIIVGHNLPIVGMAFDWGDAADEPEIIGLYVRAVEWVGGGPRPDTPVPVTGPFSLLVLLLGMAMIAVLYFRRFGSNA